MRKKTGIGFDVFEFRGNQKKKIFEYRGDKSNTGIDIVQLKMGMDIKAHSNKIQTMVHKRGML